MASRFIGLDGEMTGSGTPHGEAAADYYQLCQIGVATSYDRVFTSDIGWERFNYQDEALRVNGFSLERIKNGPQPGHVDTMLRDWIRDNVAPNEKQLIAVGWNVAGFDIPFVRKYLPNSSDFLSRRTVDLNAVCFSIAGTAGNGYKKLKRRVKKEAAWRVWEHASPDWHNAGYDALASLSAFHVLMDVIKEGKQNHQWKEIPNQEVEVSD